MSIPILAFFNNKGGVGKTSLVYHVAWMYSEIGLRVLAADLDPQANMTAAFFDESELEDLWNQESEERRTIYDAIEPLTKGIGDVEQPDPRIPETPFAETLPRILPGDLRLSRFEDDLAEQWPKCLDGSERAFRVSSAFWRILQGVGRAHECRLILIDVGPNLGAINRAALLAADSVAIPVSADLFSLQGLRNLGPTLRAWRKGWKERLEKNPNPNLELPDGKMAPLGYVIMQHAVRLDRPVRAYERWAARIPVEYRGSVLGEATPGPVNAPSDPHCLMLLKHYRSLMPLAQDARKPMFFLKPADGAIGAHFYAVQNAFKDFRHLARELARRLELELPETASASPV